MQWRDRCCRAATGVDNRTRSLHRGHHSEKEVRVKGKERYGCISCMRCCVAAAGLVIAVAAIPGRCSTGCSSGRLGFSDAASNRGFDRQDCDGPTAASLQVFLNRLAERPGPELGVASRRLRISLSRMVLRISRMALSRSRMRSARVADRARPARPRERTEGEVDGGASGRRIFSEAEFLNHPYSHPSQAIRRTQPVNGSDVLIL